MWPSSSISKRGRDVPAHRSISTQAPAASRTQCVSVVLRLAQPAAVAVKAEDGGAEETAADGGDGDLPPPDALALAADVDDALGVVGVVGDVDDDDVLGAVDLLDVPIDGPLLADGADGFEFAPPPFDGDGDDGDDGGDASEDDVRCQACRGRHVRHTCGKGKHGRPKKGAAKAKGGAAAARAAAAAAERRRAADAARERADARKPPVVGPPPLEAFVRRPCRRAPLTTASVAVSLVGAGAEFRLLAAFPRKLRRRARADALSSALAAVRRASREDGERGGSKSPRHAKPGSCLSPTGGHSPGSKKRGRPRQADRGHAVDAYQPPPLDDAMHLDPDSDSDNEEDTAAEPENGLKIRAAAASFVSFFVGPRVAS